MTDVNPKLNHSQPQYFYLQSDLWRSSLYIVVSLFLLIIPSSSLFILGMQQRPIWDFVLAAIGPSLLGIYGSQFLFPRYRLDEHGISQRLFLPIWDLWAWDEFASHTLILQLEGFTNPSRPFWGRRLKLMLDTNDLDLVMATIQKNYQPPLAPPLPETIRIKNPSPFCRAIEFTPQHLRIEKRSRIDQYDWRELKPVECWTRLGSEGFRKITLPLPNRKLILSNAQPSSRVFPLGSDIQITRYFRAHGIPFVQINVERPPSSRAEYEIRFEVASRRWKEAKQCIGFITALTLAFVAWNFFLQPDFEALWCSAVMISFVASMCIFLFVDVRREKRKFQAWRSQFDPN